jgi:hypothetical protein
VQAEAVAAQPDRAGAASGLLTSLQMVVGAITVQAIGFAHDGTPQPLFVGLVVCSIAALAPFTSLGRSSRRCSMDDASPGARGPPQGPSISRT